jgi:hypothetical protein
MLKKVTLLTASALSVFAFHQAEININDKDLELSAKFDMGQFIESVEPDTTFVGVKFLNADKDNADLTVQKFDPYYEANFLVMRPIGNMGMKIGLGVKANYTKSFTSIPLGLEFSYKMPFKTLVPMYLNGEIYYAPSVLSYQDGDSFMEYRISYDIELIKNAGLTLGYRNLDTNYVANKGYAPQGGDFNYNSTWYAGFKVKF